MTDPILDDVKALLDKDFGDDRILKQIFRACENNEIISNYERNYVRKLSEKHLGRKPEVLSTPLVEEKPTIPDVVMPETESVQNLQTFQVASTKSSRNLKKSKMMFGIGGIVLVIVVIAAISFSGISIPSSTVETSIVESSNSISDTLFVQTDFSSYNKKDIIAINGVSDTSGTVNLSIETPNGKLVWAEQVSLKTDGRYSTLVIAGGPGWENSGTYTIKVDNGEETKSNTFSFIV
jgi:hypothetical protein